MRSFNLVYITTKNKKEARKIGGMAVKNKLAACANIIGGAESIYKWKGKIQKEKEAVVIIKTEKRLIKKLIDFIKTKHSYKCPCILVLPVLGGDKNYLKWISENLK